MNFRLLAISFLVLAALVLATAAAFGQESTPITYQGYLEEGNGPADGVYDFRFRLFASRDGNQAIGQPVVREDVRVTNGLFTVRLDFGAWGRQTPYLEVAVRPGGSNGEYVILAPRQPITAAPVALSLPGFHTTQVSNTFNLIGGHALNAIVPGVLGGTIGGGGDDNAPNQVLDAFGVVAGGAGNRAGSNDNDPTTARYAVVVGGDNNQAAAINSFVGAGTMNINQGSYAFIGAGRDNTITEQSGGSVIGGGRENQHMDAAFSMIGGGYLNTIDSSSYGFLGGGQDNHIYDNFGVIGGGAFNSVGLNDGAPTKQAYGTVGGGTNNRAEGFGAVVPGGVHNTASGAFSFAAGTVATAQHDGSFVWSDHSGNGLESSADNQFSVLASGGVRFFSAKGVGVELNPNSGSWAMMSDRNVKTHFAPVDKRAVLEKVVAMPIESWQYIGAEGDIRHIGPTAQDFYAAFGLGDDDRTIAAVDADGVALTAIQGLYAVVQEQNAAIEELRQENVRLAAQIAALQNADGE